jgi:predicted nucleic acid-binding protein
MDVIADTNFIIALERERKRGRPGPAHAFCEGNAELRFFLTFTVTGELACGTSRDTAEKLRRLVKPYPVIPWSKAA